MVAEQRKAEVTMNSGTYYLYEYKHDRRIRTAGFLKLTCTQSHTQLQLHARSLPSAQNDTLKLYSFHKNGTDILPEMFVELNTVSGNLCAKISSKEYPFLTDSSLAQTDGFFLVLPDQTILAAVAPDVSFDTRHIRKSEQADKSDADADADKTEPMHDTELSDTAQSGTTDEINPEVTDTAQSDTTDEINPDTTDATEIEVSANTELHIPSNVRKLHRCDLSGLPRKQWYLANNSFLLHGCHNYGHLILIKEDGRYWLGVPGIYDPKEARAAEMFGFPRFTDSYNDQISRTEEEENPYGTFGYWCRSVFPDAASPLCF